MQSKLALVMFTFDLGQANDIDARQRLRKLTERLIGLRAATVG